VKVLHVITSIVRGGAETHLVGLACGQVARGANVTVAYLKGQPYWSDTLTKAGIAVEPLGLRTYGDPWPVLRLRALLHRVRPDILHAHLPPAELYGRLALLGGKTTDRFVISRHNEGQFYKGVAHRQVGTWVERRADIVIAISKSVRDQTCRYLNVAPERIRTICYGIDPEPYRRVPPAARKRLRAQWGVPDDAFLIGTVARLVPQKAVHVLLEGYARYRRTARHPSYLVVVGRGALEAELKTLSVNLGLEGAVIWAGFREDIPVVMNALDLFALSSQFEGFALVLLEAMSAGKAIIATRVSAVPEVVEDGVTGLLCPPGDPAAFGECLRKMEDAALRAGLGAAGSARANAFTLERMVEETLVAYRELLYGRS
jgi:glycosyltransferase involved in cell wall biosynthesis